jgi:hypothetical protein
MKLLTAKVTRAPKIVSTKHGERFVFDVEIDGETQAIWGPPSMIPTAKNGEFVTLGRDSKNKLHIVEGANTPVTATETTAANPYTLDKDTKKAIASYISQQKDLLQFCWQQAEAIEGPQTEDSIEKLAVTLYLSAQRKFGLT